MTDIIKAANEADLLLKQFRNLFDFATSVSALGVLAESEASLRNNIARTQKELEGVQEELSRTKLDLTRAAGMVAASEAKAKDLVAQAEIRAAEITGDASAKANAHLNEADYRKGEIVKEIEALTKEKSAFAAAFKEEKAAGEKELSQLQTAIDKLKAKFA